MTTAPASLAELTTLRVGGPAERIVVADDEAALLAAVREADATGTPALVVGGGSNLVVADEGYAGTVVSSAPGGSTSRPIPAAGHG